MLINLICESGINFILYYAPEILEMAGFGTRASLFNSVLIGVIMIIFTFLGFVSAIYYNKCNTRCHYNKVYIMHADLLN